MPRPQVATYSTGGACPALDQNPGLVRVRSLDPSGCGQLRAHVQVGFLWLVLSGTVVCQAGQPEEPGRAALAGVLGPPLLWSPCRLETPKPPASLWTQGFGGQREVPGLGAGAGECLGPGGPVFVGQGGTCRWVPAWPRWVSMGKGPSVVAHSLGLGAPCPELWLQSVPRAVLGWGQLGQTDPLGLPGVGV